MPKKLIVTEDSDDEIELKPQKQSAVSLPEPVCNVPIETIQTKPKRKLNLSDEERERRRQSMIACRALKKQQVSDRQKLEEQILKQKEEETKAKMLKNIEKLKKKKEKEIYNQLLNEEVPQPVKTKKQPKIIYQEESSSEEEVVVVKKKKAPKAETPIAQTISQPIPQIQPFKFTFV